MSSFFWITYAVQWLFIVVLVVMVLLLYRQFGLMLMSGSGRANLGGLDIGKPAPALPLQMIDEPGTPVFTWNGSEDGAHPNRIVLLANPQCPICEGLWSAPDLERLATARGDLQWLWIDSRSRSAPRPTGWSFAISEDNSAADAMDVPVFPFAYAIDSDGIIAAKRLVNTADDLDLLAQEAFPSGDQPKGMKRDLLRKVERRG